MGVVIPPESELGKELARWDAKKRDGGMNANGYEPYPRMLYMAHRWTNGKVMCGHPLAGQGIDPEAMAFDTKCYMIVPSAEEHEKMARAGWSDTQQEAIDAFEKHERETADAAAGAQFQARRMSAKAQKEFDDAQDAAEFHDPEVKAPKLPPKAKKK